MTLTFRLVDNWSGYVEATGSGGALPMPKARIVTITLTPEQEALVKPREVGRTNMGPDGKPVYEEIVSVDVDAEISHPVLGAVRAADFFAAMQKGAEIPREDIAKRAEEHVAKMKKSFHS